MTRAFPAAILVLQLGAAVVYGVAHEWRACAYWLFASGLTIAVTK